MTTLTPEAKELLSTTVRGLRERLLRDIHDEADRRYRLSVAAIEKAGLDEANRRRRERLEAWLDERVRAARPKTKKDGAAVKARLMKDAEKEAAATFLNRIVLLRHLEALKLSKPEVVTGGWKSKGYREFREFAPGLVGDETEGYATLLQLVFDELAVDLPGLFGDVGLTRLFPVPPAALREVIERLDDERLTSAWSDDTTLGWVYQYWNDPEREALDAKINGGGKIEPHEIASKTQMFTERYMVEWLLHNSLGLLWFAICRKNGWKADAESVLPGLDARRAEWRKKREAGEVALDALMPIEKGLEDRWKYFVPQPIPDDAAETAPRSIREVKLLDPACGSGHFLVIAFDLLVALYREEARHTRTTVTDREIAESILENNLFGIDIDSRAIQLAAAGLYLKARATARDAHPKRVNLVAPTFPFSSLPKNDPALVELRRELAAEAGLDEARTNQLLAGLEGVEHLGSLFKVEAAVREAVVTTDDIQLDFEGAEEVDERESSSGERRRKYAELSTRAALERFLAKHSGGGDLGLRLAAEQLAAGVRFIRIAQEGKYDLVVGNPPYQGTSKMAAAGYVKDHYKRCKADLYAAFLERGLELTRPGGLSALLTMRGWMFLGQFAELRKHLLHSFDLRSLGDFDRGAFDEVPNEVLAITMSVFRRAPKARVPSVAAQPTPLADKSYDRQRTSRKRAAVLAQVGRYEFDPHGFDVIEGEPIVYWWSKEFLERYARAPKLGFVSAARKGLCSGNDGRFLRRWFEIELGRTLAVRCSDDFSWPPRASSGCWVPFVKGAAGREWVEELAHCILWTDGGIEVKMANEGAGGGRIVGEDVYFRPGIAFSMIGSSFSARAHRYKSIIGHKGSSVYPDSVPAVSCLMNSSQARFILQSLNPGIGFEVGDVNRLPIFPVADADCIYSIVDRAFTEREFHREASVEFRRPGPSPWTYAQGWAQRAVDRPEAEPLPTYAATHEPASREAFVSFACGAALGRFGENGEGVLRPAPRFAVPSGVLFLSPESPDALDNSACALLRETWQEHGITVGDGDDLRTYLRKSFFTYHKKLYENRPIYFPISSAKKSFVAFVSIHRWKDDTLSLLLADHLMPERRRLEGELEDLRKARAEKGGKAKAEKRFAEVQSLLDELNTFIDKVTEVAEKGPPPPDDATTHREVDARYVMDLDDGVMVNSAALWPLLEPQWKDPKKWWKELATAQGRKDYDWAHLAARYFPKRVAEKCIGDPSLAVAHKCFWRLHPAKAYAWELRLQDEIKPDFTIDEPGSDAARAKFLAKHAPEAEEIRAHEARRRERKARKANDEDADDTVDPQHGDDTEEAIDEQE